ncbi:MAG: hypothetical protein JXA33_16200 [Anaerolineae bacterium]|nr:hypothetical protein [Anaerolineae bacterium]
MTTQSTSDSDFHIRQAQPGDLCVLLEPADPGEIADLIYRQHALQAWFGGDVVTPVHLTCQRFILSEEEYLDAFIPLLRAAMAQVAYFSLTATAFQILDLPSLQTRMLKWRVEETDALRNFVVTLNEALSATGATSLYAAGAVANLVSALISVPILSTSELVLVGGFPYSLYTARRVQLSRIDGPGVYTVLATMGLGSDMVTG